VPSQETKQADLLKNKSVDSLLNDIQHSPSVAKDTRKQSQAQEGKRARRKTIDRRETKSKRPPDELERRDDENRRLKKTKAKPAKSQKQSQQDLNELKLQQHRKKILLAGCEPVTSLNYDSLAMDDYPDNALVSAARRDRDTWLLVCAVFSSVFFFGILGFFSPWVAGVGCGLAFVSAVFAFSPVRRFFFARPHLHALLSLRKQIEFKALNHVQHLEGGDGLAWRCAKMLKYNTNLGKKLFTGLYHYSQKRELLQVVRTKKHIRLYLLLMIESQKAYKRLEKDYLESHFSHLDQGWDDRIDDAEAVKLEQSLNANDIAGDSRQGS
jgi:hypothetical protein